MSVRAGPSIAISDMIFQYDMYDNQSGYVQKTWRGRPTTNLIPYSQDFTTSWDGNLFSNWINSTVTSNASIAPDGTLTADRLTGYYSKWTTSITATISTTYTFSCWLKNVSLTNPVFLHIAFGLNGTLVSYNNVTSVAIASISDWTRFSVTVTSPASGINQIQCGIDFGASKGNTAGPYAVDVWGAQLETGSTVSPYILTGTTSATLSATQGLVDIVGGKTITINSLTYASDNTFSFNGSSDSCYFTDTNMGNGDLPWTVNVWIKTSTAVNGTGLGAVVSNWNSGPVYCSMGVNNGKIVYWTYQSAAWTQKLGVGKTVNDNVWHMLTWVNNNNFTMDMYVDGLLDSNVPNSTSGNNNPINAIGRSWAGFFAGSIASVAIYNRSLTASEVSLNFAAHRNRYGV